MRSVIALAIVAMASARVAGAQIAAPPRDRPNAPASTGTASVRGRVIDAQTGSAITRARVRLDWMGPSGPRESLLTDSSGQFAFTRLPSGLFTISVQKSTFLPTRYPTPRQTFRTISRPLSLADAQTIDDIVVPMYHGGAITGRVLDANGDPVENVMIQALRLTKTGKPQPRFGGGGSNDAGEFRVSRLEPGDYLLLAMPQRYFDGPDGGNQTEPVPAPTFYPGVLSITDAQPISVARGATVSSVDLQLIEGQTARVSGRLVDSTGQPVTSGGSIAVRPIFKDLSRSFGISGTGVKPDGSFQLTLPYGDYELEGQLSSSAPMGGPVRVQRVGLTRLTVTGDLPDVVIALMPPSKISGRFVFAGTQPPPEFSSVNGPGTVAFASDDGFCRSSQQATIAPDWTFTVDNVSGTCAVRFYGNIPRWYLTAIRYGDDDVLDKPIAFAPGRHVRGIEIVMTDRPTRLMFHVTDNRGEPTRDYVALVFPADKSRWVSTENRSVRTFVPPVDAPASPRSATPGGAAGNRVFVGGTVPGSQVSAMNPSPREQLVGLPPGEYFAVAVDDLDIETFRDPEVLERLSRSATRVTLADGAHADVYLRRVTQPLQ